MYVTFVAPWRSCISKIHTQNAKRSSNRISRTHTIEYNGIQNEELELSELQNDEEQLANDDTQSTIRPFQARERRNKMETLEFNRE